MGLKGAKRGPKGRTGQNRVAQAKQGQIGRTGQNRAKQGQTGLNLKNRDLVELELWLSSLVFLLQEAPFLDLLLSVIDKEIYTILVAFALCLHQHIW